MLLVFVDKVMMIVVWNLVYLSFNLCGQEFNAVSSRNRMPRTIWLKFYDEFVVRKDRRKAVTDKLHEIANR